MTEYEILHSLKGKTVADIDIVKHGHIVSVTVITSDGAKVQITSQTWFPFNKPVMTVKKF